MSGTLNVTKGVNVEILQDGFEVALNGVVLLQHTIQKPMLFVGHGEETIEMYRGNFDIKDYVTERTALRYANVEEMEGAYKIDLSNLKNGDTMLSLIVKEEENRLKVEYQKNDANINRFWLRVAADKQEKVYGCGEQLSHFNM